MRQCLVATIRNIVCVSEELLYRCLLRYLFLLGLVFILASPSSATLPPYCDLGLQACLDNTSGIIFFDDIHAELRKWPLSVEFTQSVENQDVLIRGVHLIIFNDTGVLVFDEVVDAPLFVANMAPGVYCLTGTYEGVGMTQTFEIISGTNLNILMNWS